MPRRSVADARATRTRIIERAGAIAAVHGLEGVTIGRLAADLDMSKAGVLGHFGSKQALQLAAFAAAVDAFVRAVPARVDGAGAAPGLDRLRRLCDAWIDYLESDAVTPGGCRLTSAAAEFEARTGPVRDAVATASQRWLDTLAAEARRAVTAGGLPASTDVDQLVFELNGIALGANQAMALHGDRGAPDRARRAMRRLLGTG